jgi:surface antigen
LAAISATGRYATTGLPVAEFTDLSHRQCRLYVTTVSIEGRSEHAWAAACRNGDGQWALAK